MSRGEKEQERLGGLAAFNAKVLVRLRSVIKPSGDLLVYSCLRLVLSSLKHVSCMLPQGLEHHRISFKMSFDSSLFGFHSHTGSPGL